MGYGTLYAIEGDSENSRGLGPSRSIRIPLFSLLWGFSMTFGVSVMFLGLCGNGMLGIGVEIKQSGKGIFGIEEITK